MTHTFDPATLSAVPLHNAQMLVAAIMPRLGSASISPNNVRSFNLGEVDGQGIEFTVGLERAVFAGSNDPDKLFAMFASADDLHDPCLWFAFDLTDTGEIIAFQLHSEFGEAEATVADLFEIWSGRLATLSKNIVGFAAEVGEIDDNPPLMH